MEKINSDIHTRYIDPLKLDHIREQLFTAIDDAPRIDLSWMDPSLLESGWSLDRRTLDFLGNLLTELKPEHILEFGSGLSTQFLLKACTQTGINCAISSVDHDSRYSFSPAESLCYPTLKLQIAPIVARNCASHLLPVYQLEKDLLASSLPSDLILIDGPPQVLGGRAGVFFQCLPFTRPGTVVLLDDADRKGERSAIALWQSVLQGAIEVIKLPGFSKGLAAIIIKKDLSLYKTEVLGFHEHIDDILLSTTDNEVFILVDDQQIGCENIPLRTALPFLEKEGQYWGSPVDESQAISEFDRLLHKGVRHIIFAEPAFWWLSHYPGFHQYLRMNFSICFSNDRIIAFDLHPQLVRSPNEPAKQLNTF